MKVFRGIVKATGALLTVDCGFLPDKVELENITDETGLIWDINAFSGHRYGRTVAAAGTVAAAATAAAGVVPFAGVGPLAAASTVYTTTLLDTDVKDSADAALTGWTLGSLANKTGNFNAGVNTALVGVGSKVVIMEKDARYAKHAVITAITNDGDAANEITLDIAVQTGEVQSIGALYTHVGAAAGRAIGQGFTVGASATVNDTDGDFITFAAWQT